MRIVVCIRKGVDGELSPFDACALEEALKIENAEVILLSMGTPDTADYFKTLSRLGAKRAVLLSDPAFAGADTLATAYTLSLAIKKLSPDLVFCGRKTLVGDTGQVPAMLADKLNYGFIGNVMKILSVKDIITCKTRECEEKSSSFPAVITVERINNLRLPSIFSKSADVEVLTAKDIGADINFCGLNGSPTRVIETKENISGRRKCKFITISELDGVTSKALKKGKTNISENSKEKLSKVYTVGKAPFEFAKSVSDDITVLPEMCADKIADIIKTQKPNAVLFSSDYYGKSTSAFVSSKLDLGLCADCTSLQTDGNELFMIRPALSGSVIAKIKSRTVPALATVRTESKDIKDVIVCAGYGAKDSMDFVKDLVKKYDAELGATRKAVDNDILPYEYQIGLTGKTVAPSVYIAVGVSGAVHHIVGMQKSGTVIAINPDKDAPIFDYADYGIVTETNSIVL